MNRSQKLKTLKDRRTATKRQAIDEQSKLIDKLDERMNEFRNLMVDGVPTGMLLVDARLLKIVWDNSPEYLSNGIKARRVFETPGKTWFNEETGAQEMLVGTSDLDWCKKVIENGYLEEHWPELAKEKYPYVIDTKINCMHIDRNDGTQFPIGGILAWCEEHGNV